MPRKVPAGVHSLKEENLECMHLYRVLDIFPHWYLHGSKYTDNSMKYQWKYPKNYCHVNVGHNWFHFLCSQKLSSKNFVDKNSSGFGGKGGNDTACKKYVNKIVKKHYHAPT